MNPKHPRAVADLDRWNRLDGELPKSVEYKKEESGFFTVFSYNRTPDHEPTA